MLYLEGISFCYFSVSLFHESMCFASPVSSERTSRAKKKKVQNDHLRSIFSGRQWAVHHPSRSRWLAAQTPACPEERASKTGHVSKSKTIHAEVSTGEELEMTISLQSREMQRAAWKLGDGMRELCPCWPWVR